MINHFILRKWLLLSAITAALLLSGCGGGGGSSSSTPPADEDASSVSGTAAAGAPLVGFVGARDNADNTATADIAADGSFELDVSDLNPPVLIYASGIAGGNAYQLLSVAFEGDVDGTVNVTPLTDLILGNAVGRSPQEFFNNPDFDLITQDAVDEQEAALKARLKPLLDGLDVPDDFNLRNSAFVADRSGIDAVLDVIEVRVDSGTNTATIRSRVDDGNEISNSFTDPDTETEPLAADDNLQGDVSSLQALDTLAQATATALEEQDEAALESLVTSDFLNNGETIAGLQTRLFGSEPGIEDAGELADEIRNWSLVELGDTTARLNLGAPQGPWNAINENGAWKLQGNQLEFLVFVEPTHVVENGAETPEVLGTGTMIYAGFPAPRLGDLSDSSVTVSGDLMPFNGELQRDGGSELFSDFQVLNAGDIANGDQVTFAWDNTTANASAEATYTIRRGSPDLSNGAPEITTTSADLDGDEYTFEWTLPPGYDSVSVRNNFTGQTQGGEGGGFTGNPLDNDARSFTGDLPADYVPGTGDELRLIARDPFGVFVSARLINPFPDQVPPPMAEDALIGSWIARNSDRGDNAPWVQLTFLESGYYMHQELDLPYRPAEDDAGTTGIEFGRYEWDNQTGELTVPEIIRDDNGFWGLTDVENGEERIALQVDGDTLTAFNPEIGPTETTEFSRVLENQSGIAGSWIVQDSEDPTNVSVLTILEDNFYFLGTNQPADSAGEPGLEFGTYTYDSQTTVLEPAVASDNNGPTDYNGEFGLSDPIQGFDYATVIDGFLIIDDAEAFQLSEVAPNVPPSDGSVTVDYTAPDSGSDPSPGDGVSGSFHYLRSSSGIEGERPNGPGSVYMASYNYPGTVIVDNGDGTGAISYDDWCVGDVLIDAGINEVPVFDSVAFCFGASGSLTDLTFTENGATLILPAEEITYDDGGQEQLGQSDIDLMAMDDASSLLLGFGKRTFGYETDSGITSGLDTSVHFLGEKGSGMAPGDLEGDWGWVSFQLSDVSDNPDAIEYNALALSVTVDSDGAATLLDEEYLAIIQGGNTSDLFVAPESSSSQIDEVLGNLTLTDDGELGLFGGEYSGFLSVDQQALFLTTPSPTATDVPNDLGNNEWVAGIRRGATPLQESDLIGKEYARVGQFYWVGEGYFEVDYSRPGSTLTFPVDSNIAEYRREVDFTYTGFGVDSPVVNGESSNTVGYDFEYEVDPDGLLRMTANISSADYTDDVTELGWANADASVILIANQYLRHPNDGTDTTGGVGISYLICTNCD